MRSGVISDFTATKAIVRVLLYKVCKNMVFKPNIVVCMPSTVTNLEKRTILDLVTAAGAGRACLIEEPLAAALGAGLDIRRPMGTMVVDIGAWRESGDLRAGGPYGRRYRRRNGGYCGRHHG